MVDSIVQMHLIVLLFACYCYKIQRIQLVVLLNQLVVLIKHSYVSPFVTMATAPNKQL